MFNLVKLVTEFRLHRQPEAVRPYSENSVPALVEQNIPLASTMGDIPSYLMHFRALKNVQRLENEPEGKITQRSRQRKIMSQTSTNARETCTVGFKSSFFFLQKNQLDALISQIYFWNETLHVSDRGTVRNIHSFIPRINLRN